MLSNIYRKLRKIVDKVYDPIEGQLIESIRYGTIQMNSRFRNQRKFQNVITAIGFTTLSYIFFNVIEIQNHDRHLFKEYFQTQYVQLVKEVKADKNDHQAQKVVHDLISKGKKVGLTAIQILALSELVKKPQLNLHAQYLASLK